MKKEFRCPFRNCKYKAHSLIQIFGHLSKKHKLWTEDNYLKKEFVKQNKTEEVKRK